MAAKSNLATKDEPLVVERTFDAPVSPGLEVAHRQGRHQTVVFDLREFAPVVGFEFQFDVEHEGFKYCHRCKVTEVIPTRGSPTLGAMKATRGFAGDLRAVRPREQDEAQADA